MIVAIDGPAASGKGTLARRIAAELKLRYLDTGSIYRAVALACLKGGVAPEDAESATRIAETLDARQLDDPALRDPGVGEAASIVSAHPTVRTALLGWQRRFAQEEPGAVLDGRDIGTVVCPEADAKLFVTASPEIRAARRAAEMRGKGHAVTDEEVLQDILRRDARDEARASAPLRKADDADLLDTTDLSIEAAFQAALGIVTRGRI
ncbi:MAG: (d)CMP kinase [Pseudomonadota bacterium]